jgi:hypothetical protein
MLQKARNVFLYAYSPLCRAEVGRPEARVLFLGVLDVHCILNRRLRVVRFVAKHEQRAYQRERISGFYGLRFQISRVLRFEGLRFSYCGVLIVAATNPISASSNLAPRLIDQKADAGTYVVGYWQFLRKRAKHHIETSQRLRILFHQSIPAFDGT